MVHIKSDVKEIKWVKKRRGWWRFRTKSSV